LIEWTAEVESFYLARAAKYLIAFEEG